MRQHAQQPPRHRLRRLRLLRFRGAGRAVLALLLVLVAHRLLEHLQPRLGGVVVLVVAAAGPQQHAELRQIGALHGEVHRALQQESLGPQRRRARAARKRRRGRGEVGRLVGRGEVRAQARLAVRHLLAREVVDELRGGREEEAQAEPGG